MEELTMGVVSHIAERANQKKQQELAEVAFEPDHRITIADVRYVLEAWREVRESADKR